MPYSRQLRRVAPTGRIAIRLTTAQRDLFIHDPTTPRELGHALHRAPVRAGKLNLRVTRPSLERLIEVAARAHATDRREERALEGLLRYLEGLEDRFDEPEEDG